MVGTVLLLPTQARVRIPTLATLLFLVRTTLVTLDTHLQVQQVGLILLLVGMTQATLPQRAT
jgi:hypothetical protein